MALTRTQAPAKRDTADKVARGTGSERYTVKGKRATARQRAVIDGVLGQAREDRASRRVMIAAVMTVTEESNAGELAHVTTGDDDTGIYQQGRPWVSVADAKDPAASTHAFLITGPTAWKKVHGSVKKAPGNLSQAIHEVQRNRDPNAYAQWEEEATGTVDTWLASDGESEGGTYIKRYTFTRGEKGGQRENSWDAAQRLVEEVGAYRWAAGNVFYAVSGDELRAGKPSLTIAGGEGWLLREPAWSWAASRAISEVTLVALADRWDVLPGAVVVLHRSYGAMSGRWMVWNVSGTALESPEVTIVLRRPTRLRSEPASEVADRSGESGEGGGALMDAAKQISDNRAPYLYGGGHGPKLANLSSSDRLDCSSSVSLALYRSKMFDGSVAITSGAFESWGKPGKGEEFTVWANASHVWVEFYDDEGAFAGRFDTSQHDGPSGPAFSSKPRGDQDRFRARHWPGR